MKEFCRQDPSDVLRRIGQNIDQTAGWMQGEEKQRHAEKQKAIRDGWPLVIESDGAGVSIESRIQAIDFMVNIYFKICFGPPKRPPS